MADLMRSLADRSRAPPTDVLAKAFEVFFTARAEDPGVITGYQARLLIVTWKHLKARQDELDEKDWLNVYSVENLEKMLFVLSEAQCLPESYDAIQKIARFAYLELCSDYKFGPNQISRQALILYISILSMYGSPEEARQVVEKFWGQLAKVTPSPWLLVLKGFALKDDRRQMRRLIENLAFHGNKFDQASHEELTKTLIELDLFKAVQTAYDFPIYGSSRPSLATKLAVLKYAILKSETAWARPIFESLPQPPNAKTMDIMLLWEAAQGNRATALAERVILPEALTVTTLNNLLEYANAIEDRELARDFAKLADHWGLKPDQKTYLLQLESWIQAGDIEQTLQLLQGPIDANSLPQENMALVNKLITMLCLSEKSDDLFQRISSLLDPLFQDNIRLEAVTVAAVTRTLLYRHDFESVSEFLRPRLGTYDSEDKAKIRAALTDYILDLTETDDHVWEAYQMLKLAFPETGVPMRTEIMVSLFRRKRNDLAVLVFGHMRQSENLSRRPKPDTYTRCLQGIARTGDADNLELIHNMLKLDLEVELNTRILNGLMLAYAACEMAEKSMAIFRQILQSDEGPSSKTVIIFFKACEKHFNGVQEARKMMDKVKKLEIPVDRKLYYAYISALAAQCEFDLATEAIETMQAQTGYEPTRNT